MRNEVHNGGVSELLQNTICLSPVYSVGIQVQANHVLEQWGFNM
jgi:hypothetical protein